MQVVFEMKKKEVEEARRQKGDGGESAEIDAGINNASQEATDPSVSNGAKQNVDTSGKDAEPTYDTPARTHAASLTRGSTTDPPGGATGMCCNTKT